MSGFRNSKTGTEARKEDVIVYGVKRCTEVKGNDDGGLARV